MEQSNTSGMSVPPAPTSFAPPSAAAAAPPPQQQN